MRGAPASAGAVGFVLWDGEGGELGARKRAARRPSAKNARAKIRARASRLRSTGRFMASIVHYLGYALNMSPKGGVSLQPDKRAEGAERTLKRAPEIERNNSGGALVGCLTKGADKGDNDVKRRVLSMVAAVMVSLGAMLSQMSAAHAGPATDVVKTKQTALFDLLKQSSSSNDKKVATIFDEMLDYGALAEASLGTEWVARSDAEKAQFSDLLKQLVRKAYERNLKKTLGFNIEYIAEESSGGAMIVTTKAVSKTDKREEPVEIAFKMIDKGGSWKVSDIITEGVSLVSSYRSQFTKIIKKDGFPVLIQKMKDKIAKGDV